MRRIISDIDINDLLRYADENLGTYQLLYQPFGRTKSYLLMICFGISMLLMCLYDLYVLITDTSSVEIVLINLCLIIPTTYCLIIIMRFRRKWYNHLQNKRLKLLKQYYCERRYSTFELEIISEYLQKRLDTKRYHIWGAFVFLGTLLFPTWNIFVEKWFEIHTPINVVIGIVIRAIMIIVLVLLTYLMSIPINHILTFKQRKIANLKYLTYYILHQEVVDE